MDRSGHPVGEGDAARYGEFMRLFVLHQRWIHGHIYHMVHNHHDADVFQKTGWREFSHPGLSDRPIG